MYLWFANGTSQMRLRIIKLRIKDRWYYISKAAPATVNNWMLFFSFLALLLVIYDFGFYNEEIWQENATFVYGYLFLLFFCLYLVRLSFQFPPKVTWLLFISEVFLLILLFLSAVDRVLKGSLPILDDGILAFFSSRMFTHALFISVFIIEFSRSSMRLLRIRVNPSLLYAGSFFFLIVLGTGLLLLPRATVDNIGFIDALFTSASAVCVTGLIVVDTSTFFTPVGQGIILSLIQIGGLGVMIFTSFFGFFFQGSQSFQSQIMLKDFVNEERLSNIYKTLVKILVFVFAIELLGTLFIFHTFSGLGYTFNKQLWYSVFHSISAFCNAGFSVFADGLSDPTAGTKNNFNLHLFIAWLVILGGIGFPVVINFYYFTKYQVKNTWRKITGNTDLHYIPRLININTRIVVITTSILIVAGTIGFWLFEKDNALHGMSLYGQFVTSFFGAVTPRTAGFNTVDMASLTLPVILMIMFLMWVGASPSSTGGGIKTSTLAMAVINVFHIARGRERMEVFRREITADSSRRTSGIIIMSLFVISASIFFLVQTDPGIPLRALVFESISAFSTVGLSLGITQELSQAGKVILIFLMFIGRIGTLTILVAFFRKLSSQLYRFPSEQIYIN